MNRWIFRLRILLLTLAVGLVAVYLWQGISLFVWGPSIELPEVHSSKVLEVTVPADKSPSEPRYRCDEFAESGEKASCLDQLIFDGRNKSDYEDAGVYGCGQALSETDPSGCERSMANARQRVWNSWKHHKRTYLAVVRSWREGDLVIHLFIEPKDNGGWRIVERTLPMLQKPEDPEHYWLGDLIDVRWKRAESEDERWGFRPGTMYLELRNITGDGLNL